MTKCECLDGCLFFNDQMSDAEGMANQYKNQYCLGDNSRCARYMVFQKLGREGVPSDLYPNMFDRASKIIVGM